MKKNLFLVLCFFSFLYACGVKSAQKSADRAPSAELAAGKAIYTDKCGKCHPAFEVTSKSVDRWNQVLTPMIQDKAKLNEADGKLVEAYVWSELGVKGK
jgi:mono/diheme cytochrome c family protein